MIGSERLRDLRPIAEPPGEVVDHRRDRPGRGPRITHDERDRAGDVLVAPRLARPVQADEQAAGSRAGARATSGRLGSHRPDPVRRTARRAAGTSPRQPWLKSQTSVTGSRAIASAARRVASGVQSRLSLAEGQQIVAQACTRHRLGWAGRCGSRRRHSDRERRAALLVPGRVGRAGEPDIVERLQLAFLGRLAAETVDRGPLSASGVPRSPGRSAPRSGSPAPGTSARRRRLPPSERRGSGDRPG